MSKVEEEKELREIAQRKFEEAPIGTKVYVFGYGFLSLGIRFLQKFESIESAARLARKKKITWNFKMPTHEEIKVEKKRTVSAEFNGIQLVEFSRLLKKNVVVALAKPRIETKEDEDWQFRAREYLLKKVSDKTPYDVWGFLSFIPRSVGYVLSRIPIFKVTRVGYYLRMIGTTNPHLKFAEFCSELSNRVYKLPGGDKFITIDEKPGMFSPEESWIATQQSKNFDIEILYNPNAMSVYRYYNGRLEYKINVASKRHPEYVTIASEVNGKIEFNV